MESLTYKDIKAVANSVMVARSKRTAELRALASNLIKTYIDSLDLKAVTFTDSNGRKVPFVDTLIDEGSKLSSFPVGALSIDDLHAINFVIRTVVNDHPWFIWSVDVRVSMEIKQDKIYISLMESDLPIITPLKPIEGQFSQAANGIKQTVISIINSRLPK